MKKLVVFIGIMAVSASPGLAQVSETLEEIFDDGQKNSMFNVGVDLIPILGGAVTGTFKFRPVHKIGLAASLGIIPFTRHFDLADLPEMFNFSPFDTTLSFGTYIQVLAKYRPMDKMRFFSWYYGLGFRTYGYKAMDLLKVRRTKAILALGYEFDLKAGFALDFRLGIAPGGEFITPIETAVFPGVIEFHDNFFYSPTDNRQVRPLVMVDFGATLVYALGKD